MAAQEAFEPLTVNANRVYSVDALHEAERAMNEKRDPAIASLHLQRALICAVYELADAVERVPGAMP